MLFIAALSAILAWNLSHAASPGTRNPSALFIPDQFAAESLNSLAISTSFDREIVLDRVSFQGYQVPIGPLALSVQIPKVEWLATSPNVFSFKVSEISLQLKVPEFEVHQTQNVEFADGRVALHIDFKCSSAVITAQNLGLQGMLKPAVLGSQLTPLTDLSDITVAENSWSLPHWSCEGPTGLGNLIHEQIARNFLDLSRWKSQVAEIIQAAAQSEWTKFLARTVRPFEIQNLLFEMTGWHRHNQGFLLEWRQKDQIISENIYPISLPSNQPSILVHQDELANTLFEIQKKKGRTISFRLNDFSEFQKLMRSRFRQWLAWADLWHYPKSAQFTAQVQQPDPRKFIWRKNGVAQARVDLRGWIISERKGKLWNYLGAQAKGDLHVTPEFNGNNLVLNTLMDLKEISWQVGIEYEKKFGTPKFSRKILSHALEQMNKAQSLTFPLPDFQVSFGKVFVDSPRPLVLDGGWLLIPLSLKP